MHILPLILDSHFFKLFDSNSACISIQFLFFEEFYKSNVKTHLLTVLPLRLLKIQESFPFVYKEIFYLKIILFSSCFLFIKLSRKGS